MPRAEPREAAPADELERAHAQFRTYTANAGAVLLVLVATVIGILATTMSLKLPDSWPGGAVFAVILAILAAFFGAMVWVIGSLIRRQVVYTVTAEGIREEVSCRRSRVRERDISWGEVHSYRSYTQWFSGLDLLRLRTARGKVALCSAKDERVAAEFDHFRRNALRHLRANGVPEARPSRVVRAATRVVGWALLGVVVVIPVYALSMPADQRPDLWWVRWLVVVGLLGPLIGNALGRPAAGE